MRLLPQKEQLPYALYRAQQVREFDRIAIESLGIPGEDLMQRAGQALFNLARQRYPDTRHWAIFAGPGNNGGDGFVLARLAVQAGIQVDLHLLAEQEKIRGDALIHFNKALQADVVALHGNRLSRQTDLIIDAMLGTGLDRPLNKSLSDLVKLINQHQAPVLAVDIPSGLNADTGRIMGAAVKADASLTFIGLKQGMHTGDGCEYSGQIFFDGLQLPARVYASSLLSARRLDLAKLQQLFQSRPKNSHKNQFGHLLIIGGAPGFQGACMLAGKAALRAGCGLVTIATDPSHAAFLGVQMPELMIHGVSTVDDLEPLIAEANVIAIGPGLGQSAWAKKLFEQVLQTNKPRLIDADGLNLLARNFQTQAGLNNTLLTPHPGEAARLLGCSSQQIQLDRFQALALLQQRYGCHLILKGAGSLIASPNMKVPAVCSAGNPGMATAGMGDVLTGIAAALIAQGYELDEASEIAVVWHAVAADQAAEKLAEVSLIATDVIDQLAQVIHVG